MPHNIVLGQIACAAAAAAATEVVPVLLLNDPRARHGVAVRCRRSTLQPASSGRYNLISEEDRFYTAVFRVQTLKLEWVCYLRHTHEA